MSEPRSEDDGELREWAPLSGFLKEVPLQARKGLFLENVALTCIDCVQDYLAVGTSIGVVYWYNRETSSVERLRPEKGNVSITCVKVVSSVDYMVAAGDKTGTVTVFKVPKPTPEWLPEVYKQNVNRQVERYTVSGLHSCDITALEWSMNGQKLFSGDSVGVVVYTEIDFYMNLSKACEILNEKYKIVQLSFSHQKRTLLVATEFRCILAHKEDNWRVIQVGQKERTSLCSLGGTFVPQTSHPLEPLVYSCRPGFRIWQADSEGTVHKTVIFKEAVKKPHPIIRLLRPLPAPLSPVQNQDFGVLLVWKETFLVTFNKHSLLVLDPQQATVVTSLSNIRDLHSVSVINSEIFIIEGMRNIVRIAYVPDKFNGEKKPSSLFSMGELHVAPVADTLLDITNRLKEGAHKIKPFLNSSAIQTTINGHISDIEEIVPTADEALELPPVQSLNDEDIQELTVNPDRLPDARSHLFDKIGEQEFDDILCTSNKKASSSQKNKGKRKKPAQKNSPATTSGNLETNSDIMSASSTSIRSLLSDELTDCENPSSTSYNNNHSPMNDGGLTCDQTEEMPVNLTEDVLQNFDTNVIPKHLTLNDIPIPVDIQPDLRSPDTILREVQEKEKLLAEALDMKQELLSSDGEEEAEEGVKEIKKVDWMDETKRLVEEQAPLSFGPPSGSSSAQPSLEPVSSQNVVQSVSVSPVSNFNSTQLSSSSSSSLSPSDKQSNGAVSSCAEWMETNIYGWKQYSCPEAAHWLAVSSQFVCMGGPHLSLHCSPIISPANGLRWQKLRYEAVRLVLSPNAQLIWKLDFNGAYALTDTTTTGPHGDSWKLVAKNVECISLTDSEAWFVSQGNVYFQCGLSKDTSVAETMHIEVPNFAIKICCFKKIVWVLSRDYKIMQKVVVDNNGQREGTDWVTVPTPLDINVADIAIGPKNLGWIIDSSNNIYFSDNYSTVQPSWWQVIIGNCGYGNNGFNRLCDKFSSQHEKLLSIATSESAIWITNKVEPFIQMNNSGVVGHHWDPVPLKDLSKLLKWRQICAEGIFENNGQLWLLSKAGDLFYTQPDSDKSKSVVLPCRPGDVVCLAAARHVLWLLTEQGDIFIRQSNFDVENSPDGSKWRNLNLEQIERRFHLRHISCGCDVVWACDKNGDMHMVVGSPHSIPNDTFPPAWVQVEGKPQPNIIFTKVFVGPHTFMVWALDNKNNVYVREAIFPDFQIGVGWVLVNGIKATHLSISGVAVWAVTPDGSLYRRYGISQNNYIGDYWLRIPGSLSSLTVSVSEDVWGVSASSNELLLHSQKVVTFSEDEDYECAKSHGWEVL
ncbi:tectonin beta-propeller repeat-containing protein 2 isoform X2 [Lycorma delicatula]|uniref:tectonin beta-propeller repeat-containing protein 2 isoform X2 n=1 Tax=Lycorma delicatula TaxID=130591 RepID=UPI003F516C05